MSSGDSIEVVRRFHERMACADLDGALRCFHPEARFDWTESISPFRDLYVGHTGFTRFFHEVEETWEGFTPQIQEVIDCGDGRFVTPTTVSGRARASGIEMQAHAAVLWTVQDGQIREGKLFQTTADALRAL